jgi:uncharacterized membrane protein YqjE
MRDAHTEAHERPTGELLKELSDQTTTLVRKEIELAKVELAEKGKAAGQGAGMLGGAGIAALFALGCVTACAILALATALSAWLAALILAAVYAVVAGALALAGRRRVGRSTPPVPEQAVETTKEDVQWVKQRAKSARSN